MMPLCRTTSKSTEPPGHIGSESDYTALMDDPSASMPEAPAATAPERPATAPENISVSLRGFDTEEHARAFGNLVAAYVRAISRYIDLSTLDGITIAGDYAQALLDLDRGYATTHKLTPL